MANYNNYGSFSYGGMLNGSVTGYSNPVGSSASVPAATLYSAAQGTPTQGAIQYSAYGAKIVVDPSTASSSTGGSSYGSSYSSSSYSASSYPATVAYPAPTTYNNAAASITTTHSSWTGAVGYADSCNSWSKSGGSDNWNVAYNTSDGKNSSSTSSQRKLVGTHWEPSTDSAGSSSGGGKTAGSSMTSSQPSVIEAAVYSAAASYLSGKKSHVGGGGPKLSWKERFKAGGLDDPSQWMYCELCKCTCAGPLAYKTHQEGRNHKRKEEMAMSLTSAMPGKLTKAQIPSAHYFCQLCNVPCSNGDAYAMHLRGSKHQKVLHLQQRMGKPIPDGADPKVSASGITSTLVSNMTVVQTAGEKKKLISTPRMTFIGGTQLHTTSTGVEEVRMEKVGDRLQQLATAPVPKAAYSDSVIGPTQPQSSAVQSSAVDESDMDALDSNVQPIGLEYIETSWNHTHTAPMFFCKLCDCSFTDVQAKFLHTKGRRHRIQYKKKVDPSLKVDMKSNPFQMSQRFRKISAEPWRRKEQHENLRLEAEELRYEKELIYWQLQKQLGNYEMLPQQQLLSMYPKMNKGDMHPNDVDERDFTLKHNDIYPNKNDLEAVQLCTSDCERALKLVSDFLAAKDVQAVNIEGSTAPVNAADSVAPPAQRSLKGVMRIGNLSKGLLLHGHLDLELVVLCNRHPTRQLLEDIAANLPIQFETFNKTIYSVTLSGDASHIVVKRDLEPHTTCTIYLTSPAVTADATHTPGGSEDTGDQLDQRSCLMALAELRRAKWFQAKANTLQSCVPVIRVMVDFCHRVPTWNPLSQWSMELLVEKSISSCKDPISPAKALMRIFELVASGLLLEGGPGLPDPCEREPTDVFGLLTLQEKEDITNSAQHALRMIVFGQLSRMLCLQPTVVPTTAADTSDTASHSSTDPPVKRPKINS